jgi:hypothetical protein
MKKDFPGYYRPTEKEFQELWAQCIFSFDTNALLNLYRSSRDTQDSFLGVVESVKDRIWIPHQVAKEFHERKPDAISTARDAYGVVRSALEKFVRDYERAVEVYKEHPRLKSEDLVQPLKVAESRVNELLSAAEKTHPDLLQEDQVGEKIAHLFEDKVGKSYTEEELEKRCKDAELRYSRNIPPGYEDQKKDGLRKYGDAIIWFQLLQHAKLQKKPIVFVTADAKEDWWHRHKGRTLGPRPELIQEMWKTAGIRFYLYAPPTFIEYAKAYLKGQSGESLDRAVKELKKIEKQKSEEATRTLDPHDWSKFIADISSGIPSFDLSSWSTYLGRQLDREKGWRPNPGVLNDLQGDLRLIPVVKEAIMSSQQRLVGFGPWVCECGRLVAALGEFSSGVTFIGHFGVTCKCGRHHPLPAKPYRGFYFEDEWHEL